ACCHAPSPRSRRTRCFASFPVRSRRGSVGKRAEPRMQRTTLPDGTRIIIKQRRDAPAGFFHAEARGLAALRDAHALRVPEVLEAADDPQDNTPDDNGWRFFAERRLLPQVRCARDGG